VTDDELMTSTDDGDALEPMELAARGLDAALQLVQDFHDFIGRPDADPDPDVQQSEREHFLRLLNEEVRELKKAASSGDQHELAKEIGDVLYATLGLAANLKLPIGEVFKKVHQSNMTKSEIGKKAGKALKGRDFVEPDLRDIVSNDVKSRDPDGKPTNQ
jgi:NTP pyrophosphatase (non-canonical NTP hydrolase)